MAKITFPHSDPNEKAASVPVTSTLKYGLKTMAVRWGANKSETIDALIGQLRQLQSLLIELINQKNSMKSMIGTNIEAINGGKIRVTNKPGDIVQTGDNINAAISVGYDLNIPELSQIQRAIELGSKARDLEPVLFFDNGRGDQISARIAREVAEADSLRATINTVVALLEAEK